MNNNGLKDEIIKIFLNERNTNSNFYLESFKDNMNLPSELLPVYSLGIRNVTDTEIIVINEKVYLELLRLKTITGATGEEFEYFIFGRRMKDDSIVFDEIITNNKLLNKPGVDFNDRFKVLETICTNGNYLMANNDVVCFGKTHDDEELNENFNVGDLESFMEFINYSPIFSSSEIMPLFMITTQTGDFNFIRFDSIGNEFLKYPSVYVKLNDNIKLLDAYANGDYVGNLGKRSVK